MPTPTKTTQKTAAPAKKPAAAAKKPAAAAKAPAKTPAKKSVAAPTPKAPTPKQAARPAPRARHAVAAEQRRNYIEVAAYYIAERHGFMPGRELADWATAEAEIDRLLAEGRLNP